MALVGDNMERVLTPIADDLAYELKKIYGVYEVNVIGRREREIWVEIDPLRMESFGLSLHDVVLALRAKNLNLPAGILKQGTSEFLVRTVGESVSVDDFGDIAVSKNPLGGHIYIRDIARVIDTFEDPAMVARINGNGPFCSMCARTISAKSADIVTEIQETVERYRTRLPAGAQLLTAHDNSLNLNRRLGILYSNALQGLILVVISLYFFIGLRPALLTAIGIPFAVCATLILMDINGITINSISLFAMIIVLGMLVDDAIVVCENVYRYIEAGMPVREAALIGSQEVFWPVISAIATTVAAFFTPAHDGRPDRKVHEHGSQGGNLCAAGLGVGGIFCAAVASGRNCPAGQGEQKGRRLAALVCTAARALHPGTAFSPATKIQGRAGTGTGICYYLHAGLRHA